MNRILPNAWKFSLVVFWRITDTRWYYENTISKIEYKIFSYLNSFTWITKKYKNVPLHVNALACWATTRCRSSSRSLTLQKWKDHALTQDRVWGLPEFLVQITLKLLSNIRMATNAFLALYSSSEGTASAFCYGHNRSSISSVFIIYVYIKGEVNKSLYNI